MEPKFNFYDFIGYIIPGSLFFILIYWLLNGLFNVDIIIGIDSLGESLMFIITSYFIGHIIQSFGKSYEKKIIKTDGNWPSVNLMMKKNEYYSEDFKNRIYTYIEDVFNIDLNIEDIKEKKRSIQESFNLCYTLTVQKNMSSQTDIFNGIYGLSRGLIVMWNISLPISLAIILKQVFILLIQFSDLPFLLNQNYIFNSNQFVVGSFIFIFIFITKKQLEMRFKRYSVIFADSVYRNFYVWYSCGRDTLS